MLGWTPIGTGMLALRVRPRETLGTTQNGFLPTFVPAGRGGEEEAILPLRLSDLEAACRDLGPRL